MQADSSVWPSAINLQIRCNRQVFATRFRPTRAARVSSLAVYLAIRAEGA
jgi:hypothetical protein